MEKVSASSKHVEKYATRIEADAFILLGKLLRIDGYPFYRFLKKKFSLHLLMHSWGINGLQSWSIAYLYTLGNCPS
ncbi:hypothetical protein T4A_6244, partial [Trichinella pseudospiralis]